VIPGVERPFRASPISDGKLTPRRKYSKIPESRKEPSTCRQDRHGTIDAVIELTVGSRGTRIQDLRPSVVRDYQREKFGTFYPGRKRRRPKKYCGLGVGSSQFGGFSGGTRGKTTSAT